MKRRTAPSAKATTVVMVEAGRAAQAATPPQQQLIESCQGLVRSLAWKIHQKLPRGVDLDDLIAYGQIGLAQAARDFDASRGGQFSTFAWYRTRGAILDGLAQMSWFTRHAYNAGVYERMSNDFMRVERESDDEGPEAAVEPTVEQEAGWFAQVTGALSISYLAAGAADQTEDAATAATPLAAAIRSEMREKLRKVVDALPDDARQLIRATYFDGVTLQEAGQRIGISKAWASRLHAKTLRRMGAALRLAGAGD